MYRVYQNSFLSLTLERKYFCKIMVKSLQNCFSSTASPFHQNIKGGGYFNSFCPLKIILLDDEQNITSNILNSNNLCPKLITNVYVFPSKGFHWQNSLEFRRKKLMLRSTIQYFWAGCLQWITHCLDFLLQIRDELQN